MAATSSETDIPRWSSAGSVWTTTMTRPVADGHSSRRTTRSSVTSTSIEATTRASGRLPGGRPSNASDLAAGTVRYRRLLTSVRSDEQHACFVNVLRRRRRPDDVDRDVTDPADQDRTGSCVVCGEPNSHDATSGSRCLTSSNSRTMRSMYQSLAVWTTRMPATTGHTANTTRPHAVIARPTADRALATLGTADTNWSGIGVVARSA